MPIIFRFAALCIAAIVIAFGVKILAATPDATPSIAFEPYEFVANNGERIDAERGRFMVSENRNAADARDIEIQFVRFKSTSESPGNPIVYLAGGPGGSGVDTARGRRFPLFMAMREFGDVIAYDQRGTGFSNAVPPCVSSYHTPLSEPLVQATERALMHKAADECTVFWQEKGVDLAGYNTVQNALDLDDMRRALGVEKVDIWGISYGSHLALAAVKIMPDHIGKLVLAAIEGLDATVKYPARTEAYFKRLQAAINVDTETAAAYPDFVAQMNRVHAQVEKTPLHATITDKDGNEQSMAIGKMELQFVTSFFIADPARASNLPGIYAMAEFGSADRIAPLIYKFMRAEPITFTGMAEAMDIMSGISPTRAAAVKAQAKTASLGDLLNYPMPHLVGALGLDDLGEAFRTPVKTDIPALFLTGTLDGRTYPKGAREAISGFRNGTQVTVVNGGHNVFMQDPQISAIILSYMRGEAVPTKVTLPLPDFPH